MFVTVLLSLVILVVSVALMSIKIILKKDGKFPDTHVGNSTTLKSKGIHCAVTQDVMAAKRKNIFERIKIK